LNGRFSIKGSVGGQVGKRDIKVRAAVKNTRYPAGAALITPPRESENLIAATGEAFSASFFHRLRQRRFLGVFTGDPDSVALPRGGRGARTRATALKVTSQDRARQLTSSAMGRVIH
jgi:hypothetical protein